MLNMSHFSMVAFEGLSSAKSDQAKIEGFRAVPTYEAGAEPQPRMRSFICWEADIVLVDTAGKSDPFVHDCLTYTRINVCLSLWPGSRPHCVRSDRWSTSGPPVAQPRGSYIWLKISRAESRIGADLEKWKMALVTQSPTSRWPFLVKTSPSDT